MFDTSVLKKAAADMGGNMGSDLDSLFSVITLDDTNVEVSNNKILVENIGVLARLCAFGSPEVRENTHHAAWCIAGSLGIYSCSIDELYRAIGRGEISGFTVPAMNMRAIAFQSARGVFKAMRESDTGAAIFELSRGEIGFTGQRPHEYATIILCAAIAEGHTGPIFLQGDHFQVSASRFAENPEAEIIAVESLIAEAVSAGFYNIDIDASTLVDLSFDSVDAQQQPNYALNARLAKFTRSIEPDGVTISIGGEIGEVGENNSTVEELIAYLKGFAARMPDRIPGMTKLSIQSGTRHGGNVLADGSFGDMPIDFALIGLLSQTCRDLFELAGCVQHGASMLSMEKIAKLPTACCIEVHLAAAFLNAVFDNLPQVLVEEADVWAKKNFAGEWKSGWSEAQFLHHARRYPIGPFKQSWWDAEECHQAVRDAVYDCALGYFTALRVVDTKKLVGEIIRHAPVKWTQPIQTGTDKKNNETKIKDLAS
jgi:hypothetical protein